MSTTPAPAPLKPEIIARIHTSAQLERSRQERAAGVPGSVVAAYLAIPMFVTFTGEEIVQLDDYLQALAADAGGAS